MRREKFHPSIHFPSLLICPLQSGWQGVPEPLPAVSGWKPVGLRATQRDKTSVHKHRQFDSCMSSWRYRKNTQESPPPPAPGWESNRQPSCVATAVVIDMLKTIADLFKPITVLIFFVLALHHLKDDSICNWIY